MKSDRQPDTGPSSEFVERVLLYERRIHRASRRLQRLRSSVLRARLIWDLAWTELRDIEDLRPAGGFKP